MPFRRAPSRVGPTVPGVPAYFYPWPGDPFWASLVDLPTGAIVVLDPANGPGAAPDPNYTAAIAPIQGTSALLYGYVDSAYAERSASSMVDEALTYRSWYDVAGIFVDQVAATPEHRDYHVDLTGQLRSHGFQVALNPGQPAIDPAYLELADQVVVFEGTMSAYAAQTFPGWMSKARPEQLWHLVYEVDDETQWADVTSLAARRNAGIVFATDGRMPNPWDRLPPYWKETPPAYTPRHMRPNG